MPRFLIALLLACVLPLKGALAAASMPCPGHGVPVLQPHAAAAASDHADSPHHGEHDGPSTGAAGHPAHGGDCPLCLAGGADAASLALAPAGPALSAAARFPALSAPAPSFQRDGPERPPRSL